MPRNLPLDTADFRGIRSGESLYVDKTAVVRRLIDGGKYYFLSRPRRFEPITDWLEDKSLANQNREVLRSFFAALKACDTELRFALITGVSKYTKVSIFSELNNTTDLTTHPDFNNIVGFTQSELADNFGEHIEALAAKLEMGRDEVLAQIKNRYNGYAWSGGTEKIYNPFSLMRAFSAGRLGNFRFGSGTPSFLTKSIRERELLPAQVLDFIPGKLHIAEEKYYQSMIYMALSMSGTKVDLEKWVSTSLLDGVLELSGRVFSSNLNTPKKASPQRRHKRQWHKSKTKIMRTLGLPAQKLARRWASALPGEKPDFIENHFN